MSIGSWSSPLSWEGEGGSSQTGRLRRSCGLSKARCSVSGPLLLPTSLTTNNHLVLRNMLWYSRVHLGRIWEESIQILPKWTFMHRISASAMGKEPTPSPLAGIYNYCTQQSASGAVFQVVNG